MALAALEPARVLPITPTAEVWSSMSADARDAFLVQVLDALNDPNAVMGEGRPHWLAKSRVLDAMSLHFDALKRVIYLAEELPVLYPGERPFVPDVLAVLDVPQSEDDERLGWVVAQEGRGLDWVLEVLHRGDRKKDLVENVERYAHLGIPEYWTGPFGGVGARSGSGGGQAAVVPRHGGGFRYWAAVGTAARDDERSRS